MGTRSLTCVQNDAGKEILTVYRQMDGYPTGHGRDLADILTTKKGKPKPMVNGFESQDQEAFNGDGCLAASIVAGLKKGIGGIYIIEAGTRDCDEEYIYALCPGPIVGVGATGAISVSVTTGSGKLLFAGTHAGFIKWIAAEERKAKKKAS